MGDIAFLLIIFFLVCSEVSKDKNNIKVNLPLSEHVVKTKAVVVARVAVDETGEIYFDGERVDNAKDIEWGVRALLTNTVSDDQRHVQFKCDKSQPREVFEPVLQAIAAPAASSRPSAKTTNEITIIRKSTNEPAIMTDTPSRRNHPGPVAGIVPRQQPEDDHRLHAGRACWSCCSAPAFPIFGNRWRAGTLRS